MSTRDAAAVVMEATVASVHDAMLAGRVTGLDLVRACLARIDAYDRRGPELRSLLAINTRAEAEAAEWDRRRAAGSPCHPCGACRSCSRTTSTRPTCRRPVARVRWPASVPRLMLSSWPGCARPAPSCSRRRT
ncbi:MAG: hypothetical protein R2712_13095 [Vicinamibacterales bacterium]